MTPKKNGMRPINPSLVRALLGTTRALNEEFRSGKMTEICPPTIFRVQKSIILLLNGMIVDAAVASDDLHLGCDFRVANNGYEYGTNPPNFTYMCSNMRLIVKTIKTRQILASEVRIFWTRSALGQRDTARGCK
jgi:hypothetical protein